MFKLIKIFLGLLLFIIGINLNPTLFALFLTMIGCYFLSRPIALEFTGPGYFIMGAIVLIPVFFLTIPVLKEIQIDTYIGEVFRFTLCLIAGVVSFLSIKK